MEEYIIPIFFNKPPSNQKYSIPTNNKKNVRYNFDNKNSSLRPIKFEKNKNITPIKIDRCVGFTQERIKRLGNKRKTDTFSVDGPFLFDVIEVIVSQVNICDPWRCAIAIKRTQPQNNNTNPNK